MAFENPERLGTPERPFLKEALAALCVYLLIPFSRLLERPWKKREEKDETRNLGYDSEIRDTI